MRPLSSQLCITPPYKLFTNSTHAREERGRRNRNVQVCEMHVIAEGKISLSYVAVS